jgi:hypothetical protein
VNTSLADRKNPTARIIPTEERKQYRTIVISKYFSSFAPRPCAFRADLIFLLKIMTPTSQSKSDAVGIMMIKYSIRSSAGLSGRKKYTAIKTSKGIINKMKNSI